MKSSGARSADAADAASSVRGAAAARCEQRRHRQHRAVEPESLEAVVEPLLAVEDVHDEVAEVEEDPSSGIVTLASMRLGARLAEHVLDLVGDRDDVALGRAR